MKPTTTSLVTAFTLTLAAFASAQSSVDRSERLGPPAAPLVAVDSPLRIDSERVTRLASASVPLEFDAAAYEALRGRSAALISEFPLAPMGRGAAPRSVQLDLRRSNSFGAHTVIVAASVVDGAIVERPIETPDIQIFRGTIVGEPGSVAFMAFSPHGTHGYIRSQGVTQVISPGPFGGDRTPLIYNLNAVEAGAIKWRDFVCSTETHDGQAWPDELWAVQGAEGGLAGGGAGGGEPPCRRIEIAIETDKEFTDVLFGGNTAASGAYAATVMAAASEISERDVNLTFDVVFVRLWEGSDPWTGTNTSNQLFEFRDVWNATMGQIDRQLAHYLSGRNLGGGVAWLNAVCHPTNAYGLSANLNGFFPYPLQNNSSQNWDPMVVTHELGHNIGTGHTHDYCPPLDQCAPSGFFGSCQESQACISNGTLMSYCHLCSGGLSNVVLEFHPVVRQTIINYLSSVGNCYIGCIPPSDVILVPQDSPSIQEAIIAVNPGGQVIVSPGIYNETIRPFGKPVHILSTDGPSATIIDATGLGGSVARFSNGETTQTILEGFTLTGGTGSSVNIGGSTVIIGGGVYVANSSPRIVDCVIIGNTATFGGGIFCNSASPIVENSVIADNSANPSSGGGAFNFANSAPQYIDSVFSGNIATANGGAMSNQNSSPITTGTTFVGNTAAGSGGAIRNIQGGAPQFINCTFADNSAGDAGGAFFIDSTPNTSIGDSSFCGSSPNDITGSYADAGGNTFVDACGVPGDLNGDGVVDGADLGILLDAWGPCVGCGADLNGDGVVDGADLGILLDNWTS